MSGFYVGFFGRGVGMFGVTIIGRGWVCLVWPLLKGGGYVWCDHYWKGVGMFGVTIIGRGWVSLV